MCFAMISILNNSTCVFLSHFLKYAIILQERKRKAEEGENTGEDSDNKEADKGERVITLRPLNMEDMKQAKNQVSINGVYLLIL